MARAVMVMTRRSLVRALGIGGSTGVAEALAACGGASPGAGTGGQSKAPATIEWFGTGDTVSDDTKRVIAAFNEKHPNVTIQQTLGGANNNEGYRAKLKTLFASDTAPDVFYLEWIIYPPYVVQGALADIDSLAKRDKLPTSDLWPAFAKQFTYKGKLWAFTLGMQTMVTWYNADAIAQAGLQPPGKGMTWQQYLDLSQKLT